MMVFCVILKGFPVHLRMFKVLPQEPESRVHTARSSAATCGTSTLSEGFQALIRT